MQQELVAEVHWVSVATVTLPHHLTARAVAVVHQPVPMVCLLGQETITLDMVVQQGVGIKIRQAKDLTVDLPPVEAVEEAGARA